MKRKDFFLIQLLLWLAVFVLLTGPVHAASMSPVQQTQAVQTLEDTLFAVRYDQEAMPARLGRLEETVFGQAQNNLSVDARITKLQGALSPSTLGPLSPLAKPAPVANNTNNAPQQQIQNNQQVASSSGNLGNIQAVQQEAKPVPGETDYPTVTRMEQKLFNRAYTNEDVTRRLERLEKQVFKTVQKGDLADRVDNLRLMVLGDTGNPQVATANTQPYPQTSYSSQQAYSQPYNYNTQLPQNGQYNQGQYNQGQYTQVPSTYTGTPISSTQPYYGPSQPATYQPTPYPQTAQSNGQPTPDTLAAMNEVEKQVLGSTYPSEPVTSRLDRLETKIFKTTSPEMSDDDRMQRVIAVASAGGAPQTGAARAKSTMQTLLPIILTILPMLLL